MIDMEETINTALDDLLCDIYGQLGIKTGDITPMQMIEWDANVHNMATLFYELINQNMA